MRWNSYYLINLNPDDSRTLDTADLWGRKYSISSDRLFAPQGLLWPPAQARGSLDRYVPLAAAKSLAPLDRSSKLVIIARGQRTLTVPWATPALARELHRWGLREVGLIAMQNDFTNPTRYLHDLAMSLNEQSIGFGWLVAYQNSRQPLFSSRDPNQIGEKPVASLRGNIMTPEADKWYFPKYTGG
jgi:hypothetical protein